MPMANTNQKGRASMKANYPINRHISTIYRLSQAYFDKKLKPYGIGCGQQFFLLRIHEHPGISVLELAQSGHYDNGTATRAIQKLEQQGYVRCEQGSLDKRVRRIYATEAALPVIEKTREITAIWRGKLTDGFTDEEREQALALLERMSQNARAFVRQGDEDPT